MEEGAGWGQGGRAAGRLRGGGDMRTVEDLVALKRRVQEADRGRSGELGMSEFVAALGGLWPHMSRKGLQRLFMQVDANSDGTVTWEELVTFLLLKDQVNDDAAHNKYLPPAGSGSNQKGLPPAELHTVAITQLLYAPAMFKDKYVTLSKDNTLKLTLALALTLTLTLSQP